MNYAKIRELAVNPQYKPEYTPPPVAPKPTLIGKHHVKSVMIVLQYDSVVDDLEWFRSMLQKKHCGKVYFDSVEV